jgi:hypothetical protein
MGYVVEFDETNNVLRLSWEGPLRDDLFAEEIARWKKLVASRPGVRCICDFSGVQAENLSSEAIRRVAQAPTQGEEEAVGVLVASTDLVFGLARMFVILTEGPRRNRHVVRTMEEAYKLFGITDPQFVRISVD